jgi:hypothetical protein
LRSIDTSAVEAMPFPLLCGRLLTGVPSHVYVASSAANVVLSKKKHTASATAPPCDRRNEPASVIDEVRAPSDIVPPSYDVPTMSR